MKQTDLDAIEARCAAATPGPWVDTTALFRKYYGSTIRSPNGGELSVWRFGNGVEPSEAEKAHSEDPLDFCDSHYQTANDAADVAFICASRSDVPALVAEVQRLRGLVEAAYREGYDDGSAGACGVEMCFTMSDAKRLLDGGTDDR